MGIGDTLNICMFKCVLNNITIVQKRDKRNFENINIIVISYLYFPPHSGDCGRKVKTAS